MKIVGFIGGIGSGKSIVVGFFKEFGVLVYIVDIEVKWIINILKIVCRKIMVFLGEKSYDLNGFNRLFVVDKIFNDKVLFN